MLNQLTIPEGLINHPQLPLPWRPSERLEIADQFYTDNIDRIAETGDYIRTLQERYLITGIGVFAVEAAIGYSSIGADVFHGTEKSDRDPHEVQREFEQHILGLQSVDTANGLRFYESRAGFSGGTYPIEPFAALVGADVETFRDVLCDKSATKFGHVIIKSSNLLVPVKIHSSNVALVHANMVTELSKQGAALVDTALFIADYSSKPDVN